MSLTDPPGTRPLSCLIVGPGRAGQSFRDALGSVGWKVTMWQRGDALGDAASEVDLVLLTVPDDVIAEVAASIEPGRAVIAHASGARPLDVLAPHTLTCSIHPLMSLPDPATGAARLADGCTFAVEGHRLAAAVVADLGGVAVRVPPEQRMLYHATATIAANHLTALCHQVETLAELVGVPADAYWKLMTTTLENIAEVGSVAALTGPASRGDWHTIAGHVAELAPHEQSLYLELSGRAARMAGRKWPEELP